MNIFIHFIPILLFIGLYVGTGLYFSFTGVENAFYQLSPTVAIIPAIVLGWIIHRGKNEQRMHDFLEGVRHRDIITMCLIFLLAGAFSTVTQAIGSVDSTVNLALNFISPQFLLVGIFLIAAFISTAIGTSMGTIATIAPIAAGLVAEGVFPASLGLATVVGGAMFGDNLSLISDTTIAAVLSQEADMRAKLKINALVATMASIITLAILFFTHEGTASVIAKDYSLLLLSPYLLLIFLAVIGVPVFIVLISSLTFAGGLGCFVSNYDWLQFSQDIAKGFTSVYDIVLLSLLVGGLSGLAGNASQALASKLSTWISKTGGQRMAQLVIAKIVSVFDILLANNTVAIIFSGEMARVIARQNKIPPHYSAAWLSIFSCVFQGLIPYGAQLLLAAAIGGISPLSLMPYVYYCYSLGLVAIAWIVLGRPLKTADGALAKTNLKPS